MGGIPTPAVRRPTRYPACASTNSGRTWAGVDNVYGDRNLVCTCDTVEEFSKAVEA